MNCSILFAFVALSLAVVYAAGDNKCCVDQPAPIVRVEKIRTDTRYRQATASQSYSTKCGTWGWRRCNRNRVYTVSQSYKFDVYQRKSYPQSCRRYACCNGFTAVKDQCYANHELPTAIGHVADIKDAVSDLGDLDLKDVFGAIHDVVG